MRKIVLLFTMLMAFSIVAFSQAIPVRGKVVDESGNAIPFATVAEKGTKRAVAADAAGLFSIEVKKGAVLLISANGYDPKDVATGTLETPLTIVLKAGISQTISEVVVTSALGIKRSARSVGYAAASISTEDLNKARANNIANGLSGKVAGLQVNTVNNGVNPETRIVLRGERSITGNNQALVVLDNIPVSSSFLNSLNPDDVSSTTVLKGANGAALYGSLAANGVIMIETNKGSKKGPSASYTHTTTVEKVSFFPKFQTSFGAASTEGDFRDPLTGYFNHVPYENQQYGPEYNGQTMPLGVPVRYTNAQGQVIDTMQSVVYSNQNAIKKFFNTGVTNADAFAYSDGDSKGTFYLSGQYLRINGTIPDDKSNRSNVRLGATRNYGRLTASATAAYTRFQLNVAGPDYNQGRPVYWNVLNTPGEIDIRRYKDPNNLFSNESNYYNAYYPNPYWAIYNSRVISQTDNFLGNATLNFKAADWADITYRVGIVASNGQSKNTQAGVTFTDYAISDPAGAGNTASGYPLGVKPVESDALSESTVIQSDLLGTFNRDFFDKMLTAKLVLGGSVNKAKTRFMNTGPNNLEIPGLYNVSNTVGVPLVGEGLVQTGNYAAFGSLLFGYKNFLFAEVTGRNDWVSVLDPKNRSFFYPGVNGSFIFTDAFAGIKDALPWLGYGKLFGGWTKVGTLQLGAYGLSNKFGQGNGFPYGSLTGFGVGTNLANTDLKPEFTTSTEIGLHLTMFNSRVNLDVSRYNQVITDQILPVQISSATGYLSTTQNIGKATNSGWDITLNVEPVKNRYFKWELEGNLGLNQTKVNALLPGQDDQKITIGGFAAGAVYTKAGGPMRALWVTDWYRDPEGHVIVDAKTGYPTVNPTLINAGRATPAQILGIKNYFTYKKFQLGILAEYRGGYNVFQFIGNAMAFTGTSAVTAVAGRGKFIMPNSVINTGTADNPVYMPNTSVAIQDGATGGGFWASKYGSAGSPFVASGAFWKLREVSLDYDIPIENSLSWVKGLSVGIVARNLLTILPKDNPYADPEYSIFGTGNAQAVSNENLSPPTRIFGATVKVNF